MPAAALSLPAAAARTPAAPAGPAPLDFLLAVYAAGAAFALGLFLVRVGRIAWMAVRCGCERHRGLRIVLCGHSGEPFSFFRFVFVDRSQARGADIDRVLAHELAHVRQLHSLDVVLAEVLSVVQWFNPFVWPYKRSLRETHEYLADRAVIAQGCPLARYQLLIVEQSVGGRLLELASSFRTSQIKRRIVMLIEAADKRIGAVEAALHPAAGPDPRPGLRRVPDGRPSRPAGVDPERPGDRGQGAASPVKMTEEEMAKALKEKAAKLDEMKKKNAETVAKLKEKLEAATDPETKAKIEQALKDQKLMSIEIGAKERMLQMKKVEMEMAKVDDPAQKLELEKKLKALQAESEDIKKKIEEIRKAEQKAKQEAEKK
ncbi:MAG: hypothetical protein MZU84_05860 [Sphingobacterium sp.]|nr:hypothetical protein [Sphingobacterium sp.]